MDRHLTIILTCISVFVGIVGFALYRVWTIEQVDEVFVTSVHIDKARGVTMVYSYERSLSFRGLHSTIVPGNVFRFIYIQGPIYSKLVSMEVIALAS